MTFIPIVAFATACGSKDGGDAGSDSGADAKDAAADAAPQDSGCAPRGGQCFAAQTCCSLACDYIVGDEFGLCR
jgi:hypothetical protein